MGHLFRQIAVVPSAGEFDGDNLSNSGEQLKLSFGAGIAIHDINEYDDIAPWPVAADGGGPSLTLIDPDSIPGPDHNLATSWRASLASGGSPGTAEGGQRYSDWRGANGIVDDLGDDDNDGIPQLLEFALASDHTIPSRADLPSPNIATLEVGGVDRDYVTLTFRRRLGADDLTYLVEFSNDLRAWVADGVFVSSTPAGGGVTLDTWRSAAPATVGEQQFGRLRVELQ